MTKPHPYALAGASVNDGAPLSNGGAHFPPSHRPAGYWYPDRGSRGKANCSWCGGEMRVSLRELAKEPEGTLTVCSNICRMAEVRWDTGTNYHGFAGSVLMEYLVGDNEGRGWFEKIVRPAIDRRLPEWENLFAQLKGASELEAQAPPT